MQNLFMRNLFGFAASLMALCAFLGAQAQAASAIVEQGKNNCVVGEQDDGYLGFVPGAGASEALQREVREINQERKVVYADLAQREGVSTDVTASLTAEKLIAQARAGQCIRNQNGQWLIRSQSGQWTPI